MSECEIENDQYSLTFNENTGPRFMKNYSSFNINNKSKKILNTIKSSEMI